MRQIIFSVAMILLIPCISAAQNFSFGVTGKCGISQITRSVNIDTSEGFQFQNKFRFSYQGGIFGNYHISDRSSVGTEILFLRQNGLYVTSFNISDSVAGAIGGTNKFYMHASYLSLPIFYSYSLGNISIRGGPQGNFLIATSGKEIFDQVVNGDSIHTDTTYSSLNFKKFDLGFTAGIRYDFTDRFFIGLDYYIGFINLIKQDAVTIGNAQNQNLSLGIGFRIVSSTQNENVFYK